MNFGTLHHMKGFVRQREGISFHMLHRSMLMVENNYAIILHSPVGAATL